MKKMMCIAVAAAAGSVAAAGGSFDGVVLDSSGPWLGFMNVFNLPEDGGDFQFAGPWGVADLVANFDDGAGTLTMGPNTINDPNEYWYQDPTGGGNPNPGGPGAPGNKIMEANLYQEVLDGSLAGQTITFSGNVLSYSMTSAHDVKVFIRDFAADFSSSIDTFADIDAAGNFSISQTLENDAARNIQWGIQVKGVNVWATDVDPFGTVVFQTIPAPGAAALLGLGGLVAARRRR
jgi:hypothetical protein